MAFNIFTTKRISCFGLHAFTPPDPNSGLVHFLFPGGFGHARLRHFFLDAGECRFAGFFFTLLLIHAPMPWVAVHFRAQPPTAPSRYGTNRPVHKPAALPESLSRVLEPSRVTR